MLTAKIEEIFHLKCSKARLIPLRNCMISDGLCGLDQVMPSVDNGHSEQNPIMLGHVSL